MMRGLDMGMACVHPYRKVDGKPFNLAPRFTYVMSRYPEIPKPVPEFRFVHGRVLSVAKEGVLINEYESEDFSFEKGTTLLFVRNYPFQVVDDDRVALFAVDDGVYQYTSAVGAIKTVSAVNYGNLVSGEESAKLLADQKAEEKRAKEIADAERHAKKLIAEYAERGAREKRNAAAIQFIKERAASGSGVFQLRLAEKYIAGEGVETNLALARLWLLAACTNGESQASNLLHKLPPR